MGDKGSITAVIKYTVHSEGATEYDAAADALNLLVVVAVAFTFPLQFFAAAGSRTDVLAAAKQLPVLAAALQQPEVPPRKALMRIWSSVQ